MHHLAVLNRARVWLLSEQGAGVEAEDWSSYRQIELGYSALLERVSNDEVVAREGHVLVAGR